MSFCGKGYSTLDRGIILFGVFCAQGHDSCRTTTLRPVENHLFVEGDSARVIRCGMLIGVHVERTIDVVKEWRLITEKLLFRQLDLLSMSVQVIADTVNLAAALDLHPHVCTS